MTVFSKTWCNFSAVVGAILIKKHLYSRQPEAILEALA